MFNEGSKFVSSSVPRLRADLFGRLVGGVAVAFDAHAGGLHAEAHVSAEPLVDAGIQHGVGAQDVQEPGIGVARIADVVGLNEVPALGHHQVGVREVLGRGRLRNCQRTGLRRRR